MHLRYDHHLSYVEAERQLGVSRPSVRLATERLRWTGHMLRSEDNVLFEAATFVPPGGSRGRPRRRYMDTIRADLRVRDIVFDCRSDDFWANLNPLASDRIGWRLIVKRDARIDL